MALLAISGLAVAFADDSSAESYTSTDVVLYDKNEVNPIKEVMTSGEFTAKVTFNEGGSGFSKISYTATFLDSSGTNMGSTVIKSGGSITPVATNPYTGTIKMTAPSKVGDYTLRVVFTEIINEEQKEITIDRTVRVVEPIELSINVTNTIDSALAITKGVFYFHIDGQRIEASKLEKTIAIGGSESFSYKFLASDLDLSKGKHTYTLEAADANNGYNVTGLGVEHEFYYDQGSMSAYTYLMVLLFIIVTVIAVWIYRKPVKNYGKPKARR